VKRFFNLCLGLLAWMLVSELGYALPILQGPTSETVTQMSIVRLASQSVTYVARESSGRSTLPSQIRTHRRKSSKFVVDQVLFENLVPNRKMSFNVYGEKQQLIDQRYFSTLNSAKSNFHTLLISCAEDAFAKQGKALWQKVEGQRPDLVVFMGDNVYAGRLISVKPDTVWDRYVETWTKVSFYHQKQLVPVLATWDDHDTGKNDSNREFKGMAEGAKIFRQFFPSYPIVNTFELGNGVSSWFNFGGIKMVLMDGRSYRAPRPNQEFANVWGANQFLWLEQQVKESSQPIFLMNGTQFFTGNSESFVSTDQKTYPHFVKMVSRHAYPFLFFSGDVHFSEVSTWGLDTVGYETLEVTSSSIHSYKKFSDGLPKNPRRLAGIREWNFISMKTVVGSDSKQIDVELTSIGEDEKPYFKIQRTVRKP
jgi:alkaline phosphatase D